jgi:hypothetical protein
MKMMADNEAMMPRGVIEYVEQYHMPPSYANLTRKVKWERFFRGEGLGKEIYSCIIGNVPGWAKEDDSSLAGRISSIYQATSDFYHQTSMRINETSTVQILEKSTLVSQVMTAITCIAKHCNITIEKSSPDSSDDKAKDNTTRANNS